MKKRRVLVLFSTVFVILLLILIVRCSEGFYGEIDLEKEQFPICDIELPPKKITGDLFMDGGSAYISVTDRKGVVLSLIHI